MKKIKKPVSILLTLMMAFGLFSIVPLTADASSITGLFDCSSGSAEGYFFYSDHFYKVEWTGINTESTAKVQLCVGNDCLYANVRGTTTYSNKSIAFFRNATLRSNWTPSEIENLIAGQSSSGYTNDQRLAEGASARVYKKVCTITCVAANAPAWDWSDDFTACTATFTCADEPSRTETVEASVSTEGSVATASVTFNSITYTETITIPGFSVNKAGDTYTIRSEEGWNTFCDCLQDNDAYNRFSGKTVELEKNISVSRMAGSSNHDFCGTFEGNGKTLTFTSSENVNGTAPFSYVSETKPTGGTAVSHPVICNLNVVCDITTSATHASGLVGRMWGELTIENCTVSGTITSSNKYACGFIGEQNGTANITNCRSSVEINSSVTGDGTHGGFIGRTMNNTSTCIEGCVFDGKIVSTGTGDDATTSCGGFVGWRDKNGSLTITNSLYTPTADDNAVADGATFARNWTMPDNANCYYTRTLGTAQGKQARTVTAGENVTLAASGTAKTYTVSGITAYENNNGLLYGDTFYAGNGDSVSLTLDHDIPDGYSFAGYTVTAGTLEGTENPYTLTMPDSSVTVNAAFDLIGDANRDGRVDISDVTAIQRHIADVEVIPERFLVLADTDGNGEVNISDATRLQMYIAHYDISLG